jgi:hypothetical protein
MYGWKSCAKFGGCCVVRFQKLGRPLLIRSKSAAVAGIVAEVA